jgi:GLPGLI family protein
MMKSNFSYIIIALFLSTQWSFAQDFQGVATYNTSISFNQDDFKIDSNVASAEQQAAIFKMLAPMLKKEYNLTFSKTEAMYEEVEKLEQNSMPFQGMLDNFTGEGGVLYKNIKTEESLKQTEFFGKIFLISDTIEKLDWKLGKESKVIGSYTCYKATAEKKVIEMNIETSANSDEIKQDTVQTTATVTAWYTPMIPVSQGPGQYFGLPGLIMEVSDGRNTILCSKVVLNPENKTVIKKPSGGKLVTQKEYEEIVKKKAAEFQEMYGGGQQNQSGGNSSIKIQIPN